MAAANISAALETSTKLVKKQRTAEKASDEALEQLIAMVTQARDQLAASDSSSMETDAVESLGRQLEAGPLSAALAATKEYHAAVNKLSKDLDKLFDPDKLFESSGGPDVCKALRDSKMDGAALHQIIAEHFYREGRFQLGDLFAKEASISNAEALKQPYIAMHRVLERIKARDLGPALEWAIQHRGQLSPDGRPSAFEFRLHTLHFISTLTTQGHAAALAYAKAHFGPYQARHLRDIQRLMGCMLYVGRPAGAALYADLLSPGAWEDAGREFVRLACGLMGQAFESPLTVSVAAGSAALPALLKLAVRIRERNIPAGPSVVDLKTCEQLPIELELGPEFLFHSIFACPVSRDQSTQDNPPMLLPCNHVLCEQSVLKIAKSRTRIFKCPYCPMEARAESLRPIVFPDTE